MAQWIFLTELQKARALYVDSYKQSQRCNPPIVPPDQWDDMSWLEAETDRLIIEWILNEPSS